MNPAPPPSLIIHGHFYQPPRENPWTEEVERQPPAGPYHDWNARIAAECYTPNGWARLLDGAGRIARLINNYAWISFDVGPTLFRWLDRGAPETAQRLLEADRDSRARLRDHGNALAHPYVHAILPLAEARDRRTLVRWGLAEFRFRFGRDAEGMWLPEAAVDRATLQVLAEHGIRFAILAPTQASHVRAIGDQAWREVGAGGIDPGRPYRYRLPDGGSIALFFYHQDLSRGIAFEGLLQSPERFADAVIGAFRQPSQPLLIVCTDGESYGHHTPGGERALATLIARQASGSEVAMTNFGAYLDTHPPTHEVLIREPSSWSCAHGVERWRSDCGCSAGGEPGWSQAWRRPLRSAIQELQQALSEVFEEAASRYLTDVWAARDDYIRVVLDRSPSSLETYFGQHARGPLSEVDRSAVLRLLEMQRHALTMETSCGWFFADISGIETVQNLRHAARAIDLASPFTTRRLEWQFVTALQAARSNIPLERDGRRIWEVHVRKARVDASRIATLYAARSLIDPQPDPCPLYAFVIRRLALERRPLAHGIQVGCGLNIESSLTLEREDVGVVARWSDASGFAGYVVPWQGEADLQRWHDALDARSEPVAGYPQATRVSLAILAPEEREEILTGLYAARGEEWHKGYEELAARTRRLLTEFLNEGLPVPGPLKAPAQFLLARELEACFREWLSGSGVHAHRPLAALADDARRLGLTAPHRMRGAISEALAASMRRLRDRPDLETFRTMREILDLADRLGCALDEARLLPAMDDLMAHAVPSLVERALESMAREDYDLAAALLRLGERLGFATEGPRARLNPIEQRLAADPGLWP